MTGLNHTLAGCLIALATPAPIAPALAFGSHFLLDAVPHFGRHPKFYKFSPHLKALILFDGAASLLAMAIVIWLFPAQWLIIGLCSFMAVLPDLMWIFQKMLRTPQWFLTFSSLIQWGERPYGWVYECSYSVAGIALLAGITL